MCAEARLDTASRAPRPLAAVVLAAGQGKRLAAGRDEADAPPKVLVSCLGLPLVEYVRRALLPQAPQRVVLVVGHRREAVEAWMADVWPEAEAVFQSERRGTGHALRLGLAALGDFAGDVLVVYGDVPQLEARDLEALLLAHRTTGAEATVLSSYADDPGGLGRIVRDEAGRFDRIVEARDAVGRPALLALREFNTGIYVFSAAALRPALEGLSTNNAQGEEYATEALPRIRAAGGRVEALAIPGAARLAGVNDLVDLAEAASYMRRRIATEHMRRGVEIVDPDSTIVEADVEIEPGARILPFSHIARGCVVRRGAVVGPFARLRGGTVLEPGAELGNFVEAKAAHLGAGAKAKHLTYLGDVEVGAGANIGCGTITANYDALRKLKHKTIIGANARVGSGTILVAPVVVGEGATTGAGTVVPARQDVPANRIVVGVPARLLDKSHSPAAVPPAERT